MPRRRGEYTLSKSTSFTIFPVVNASDKAFYSAKSTDKKLYKAKIRLNVTIAPDHINDEYEEEQQQSPLSSVNKSSYHHQLIQQKEKIKNVCSRESLQFFLRDFPKDYPISHEYMPNRNRRQLRTTSHDSSFRNSLKYSFEKMKLRATSQKYAKHEKMKSSGQMDMMPNLLMEMERNGSSGKNSWRKTKKVHRNAFVNSHEWTLCRGVAELKLVSYHSFI
ncbi:unnamed protein product [Brugia pahangi]|uniref:Uncharacterized protein n=1 Tax=Brugia pahangi TaxID=6280 RepID=A0A0N4TBG4_BRUPA|nr:unnamed protein product [Brugia pahangi]